MKRKEPSDPSNAPDLEKKQRPIASTALKTYYERLVTKATERINVILEHLERRLPEDTKLVRDEPLPSESEPEQPGFVDASQGLSRRASRGKPGKPAAYPIQQLT